MRLQNIFLWVLREDASISCGVKYPLKFHFYCVLWHYSYRRDPSPCRAAEKARPPVCVYGSRTPQMLCQPPPHFPPPPPPPRPPPDRPNSGHKLPGIHSGAVNATNPGQEFFFSPSAESSYVVHAAPMALVTKITCGVLLECAFMWRPGFIELLNFWDFSQNSILMCPNLNPRGENL